MIYYNSNTINDWNFGDDNIIKVYRNNAVCYYKITGGGDTPTAQTPCFAVVDDISQYSDTEFEDVFNKADNKWYKLNNLNQYEEYGVYGSGRTSCDGSTSRLPQGYTEVEYIENTGTSYINTNVVLYSSSSNSFILKGKIAPQFTQGAGDNQTFINSESVSSPYYGFSWRFNSYGGFKFDVKPSGSVTLSADTLSDGASAFTITASQVGATDNVPLGLFCSYNNSSYTSTYRPSKGKLYSLEITLNNEIIRDLVPAKRDSDDKYGMYDIVNDMFYLSPNNVDFSGGEPITPTDCVTTYKGKLTIDDGYEYEWNGSSWVNLGEVSGSTIIIKSPEYIERTSSFNGYCSLLEYLTEDTKIIVKHRQTIASGGSFIGDYFNNDNDDWRVFFASRTLYYDFITQRKSTSKTMPMSTAEEWEIGNYYIKNTATGTNLLTGTTQTFSSRPNQMYLYYLGNFGNVSDYGQVYYLKIYRNDVLIRDFIPWTDMNGNYGFYDKVENELVHSVGNMTGSSNVTDVEVGGGIEYPLEYVVREDPPDNLVFTSMEEAEEYECPWVGMKATIAGDKYVFSGDSQSGYEWVYNPSRLPIGYTEVEYIQNTGTSYLNIAFTPNQDTRVVCDMQNVTASNYPRLWGAGAWNSANGLLIDYDSNNFQVSWLGKTSWTNYSAYPTSTSYNRHTYDLNKNYMYIDETLVGSNTYTTRTASDPIGVFTYIGSGRPSSSSYWGQEHFKGKMYSFQIYDNETLVRDLVPCIRDNDNTVGAYDLVNDVFYSVPTGYTTDKLVAGPTV